VMVIAVATADCIATATLLHFFAVAMMCAFLWAKKKPPKGGCYENDFD